MATVGLKDLHMAVITNEAEGVITYDTIKKIAPIISADLTVGKESQILYGDNGPQESINAFKGGTIKLNVTDLTQETVATLLGKIHAEGVTISSGNDEAPYVAIGFCADKTGGKAKFVWLYKVQFAEVSESYETKGEKVEFKTPELEGTIFALPDGKWKIDYVGAVKNDPKAAAWFTKVPDSTDIIGG